jgi:hypothetical protein
MNTGKAMGFLNGYRLEKGQSDQIICLNQYQHVNLYFFNA